MAARKSKATETTGTERVKSQKGDLLELEVTNVDAESFVNQRTGDFTKGDSPADGSGNSFSELTKSIDGSGGWDENGVHTGMKDPITARPKAGAKKGQPQYEVIKGFRRYAAINLLAQRDGIKGAKIQVIVKNLDDLQALEENVFENTARDNLTGPDLAWAAFTLKQSYIDAGTAISDNQLADRMGKNQSHISRLIRIVTAAPTVTQAWRESAAPLKLDDIERISKLPPEKQETEYERVIKARTGNTGAVGARGRPLAEIAQKKAERLATTVGGLVKAGLVTSAIDWSADLEAAGVDLEGLSASERTAVGKAAHAAFALAVTPPAPKPTAATGKGAKGAAAEN